MADRKPPAVATSTVTRGGGAPASGGSPARRRNKAGNPGFRGYEYQIDATIWVALDLILARAATEEVVIEPRSEEDLEAGVKDPSLASLGLAAEGKRFDLILQTKTRSGSPWTSNAIADVLRGQHRIASAVGCTTEPWAGSVPLCVISRIARE